MRLPTDERVWIGGGVVAAVVLSAAACIGVISPELGAAAASFDAADSAESANGVLQAKVTALQEQARDSDSLVAQLRTVRAELPITRDLPVLTDQLQAQADAAGVTVTSVTVGGTASATGSGTPGSVVGQLFRTPITVKTSGSLPDQLAFLAALQRPGTRAALVADVQVQPAGSSLDAGSDMTTSLTVFTAPQSPAQAAQLAQQLDPQTSVTQ